MMKTAIKILLGTAGVLALTRLRAKEDGEEQVDGPAEDSYAMTGFQAQMTDAYERELLERQPVDLGPYEDADPTCGQFYQSRRGDTWLGGHERSITYRALYRSTFMIATMKKAKDPEALALRNAGNPGMRKALFDICVSQAWGDEVYGTYMLSSRDPIGPHGRGIPLVRFCAQNRQRILDGEAVMRVLPRGKPADRGVGTPNRKTLHGTALGNVRLAFPYLWIPVLDPVKLLHGFVTTRGMSWDADGSSGLEPPPEVVRLKIAVLS
jgi:hypothetical protein